MTSTTSPPFPITRQSSGVIELALRTQAVRTRVCKQMEDFGLDCPIRMFGSILEVEKAHGAKMKKLLAFKVISMYVERGSQFECVAFLKPYTVKQLLARRDVTSKTFFSSAKRELLSFIKSNDSLVNAIFSQS